AVPLLPREDLRVTPTGRTADLPGAGTAFTLNRDRAEELRAARERAADADPARHAASVVSAARKLSAYRDPGEPAEPLFTGRFRRDGYSVERHILEREGGYPVPYLLALPAGEGPHPVVVYVHSE